MTTDPGRGGASEGAGLYRTIQLLSGAEHGAWSIRAGDYAFAAAVPYVQLAASEIGPASCHYPIVFGADLLPLAILSLDMVPPSAGANLYVEGGAWDADSYVPAFLRRYPFVYVQIGGGHALAIDTACARIDHTGADGTALFEDGAPSAFTRGAMEFCGEYEGYLRFSEAFGKALAEKDLLTHRTASAELPDGDAPAPFGFQIVDAEKLAGLDPDTLVDWHGKGWLPLIHFHLNSLAHFQRLLNRRARLTAIAPDAADSSSDMTGKVPSHAD